VNDIDFFFKLLASGPKSTYVLTLDATMMIPWRHICYIVWNQLRT